MPFATRSLAGFCLLAVLTGLAGCQRPKATEQLDPESLSHYGQLPGLRASHHQQLADELARLTSEQATPAQLSSTVAASPQGAPAPEDLGLAMNSIVSHKKVQLSLQSINKLYPRETFTFSPIRLQNILAIRDLFAGPLDRYRELLAQPRMRFRVDLMQGLLSRPVVRGSGQVRASDGSPLGGRFAGAWIAGRSRLPLAEHAGARCPIGSSQARRAPVNRRPPAGGSPAGLGSHRATPPRNAGHPRATIRRDSRTAGPLARRRGGLDRGSRKACTPTS